MVLLKSVILLIFWCCFCTTHGQIAINVNNGKANLVIETASDGKVTLELKYDEIVKLKGEIGANFKKKPQNKCTDIENCFEGENVRLHVTKSVDEAFSIFWTVTTKAVAKKKFEDCFSLKGNQWYGGPERFDQHWPIQKLTLNKFANVLQENQWGAVVEPYWLNSQGAYIFVDQRVPLFINQNTESTGPDTVCFSAELLAPYPARNKLVLQYTVAAQSDAREGHLHAVKHILGKPTGHPNPRLIQKPIWSTWARYKRDVNDALLLEFSQEIVDNGYTGQFEIDDNWEECYGALKFSQSNFSKITDTVKAIKKHDFTVSLWVHPFVNTDCTKYLTLGREYEYFIKNVAGSDVTKWWNNDGNEAVHLDFTKPEVRNWFVDRLKKLQLDHGIDSFKFDAGETSFVPQVPVLNGDLDEQPNNVASDYVRTCATFGDLVEVRSAWKTQDLPVFVRMIDKDSKWGSDNGLYTLITTLFQMNLNGYSMVLPDMVGGNGYGTDKLDAELFVRWLQANVFMPSIQFSYVPWDFEDSKINVKEITKSMVGLHEKYSFYILKQMNKSIEEGHPVNAPIWWIDPTNEKCQAEDTEFVLGEDILVAPIITKGANKRNIYLPSGAWYDPHTKTHYYDGNLNIKDYNAPIDVLPYFVRINSEPYRVATDSSKLHFVNLSLFGLAIIKIFANSLW